MKLLSVSLAALATATLATPALADHHQEADMAQAEYPMTPQGAADWVAMVEKEMFDYSVRASKVYWVNATSVSYTHLTLPTKA